MSKGLDALEKIDHTICLNLNNKTLQFNLDKYEDCDCKDIREFCDCYEVIENELKERENYKAIYRLEHEKNQQLTQANLKMSKALEIIKENALYVDWILLFDCVINNRTYEDYIECCNATKETTYADKEEFNLLKEVLL